MNAPTPMEQYVKRQTRLLLSNTQQFLTAPIRCLQGRRTDGNPQTESKQSDLGLEIMIEIDRNAVWDSGFDLKTLAQTAPPLIEPLPASPWVQSASGTWILTGSKATHKPGTTTSLTQDGGVIAGATYNTTFTVSNRVSGSVALSVGGTAGTSRSTNATFTEVIVAGGTTALRIVPSADFQGDIDGVTIYPDTAPTDLDVKLYTCARGQAAYRSTIAARTIVFPSATETFMRLTFWVPFEEACDALDLGFTLASAYSAGNLYSSVWSKRFMWGPGS